MNVIGLCNATSCYYSVSWITSGGGSSKVKKLNYKPDNLYIENKGHITEKKFNNAFQGWGFTFF